MVYTKHLLYGTLYTTLYLRSSTKCTLKVKRNNHIIQNCSASKKCSRYLIGIKNELEYIWNFTYSWGSYIFRTTWVNHIEHSCCSFFFCNWKKGSGWKTKESHKNRSMYKSIYMSIHMIHFCTQYRKFWHVLSVKWIHFMLKISVMYIFLQLLKNR